MVQVDLQVFWACQHSLAVDAAVAPLQALQQEEQHGEDGVDKVSR